MYLPKVVIVEVRKTYIYLKNIIKWAKDNPEVVEVEKISFEALVEQLDEISSDLRSLFSNHQENILRRISEISGYEWLEEQPVIYVYPIPFFNSFSHPLFLRVGRVKEGKLNPRKPGHLLGTLIHELSHNNFNTPETNREVREEMINFTTLKILGEINDRYVEEYSNFQKMIGTSLEFENVPDEIKKSNMTIRKYYEMRKPDRSLA